MKIVYTYIFLHLLSCLIRVENTGSVLKYVDDTTSNTIGNSQFTIPNIQNLPITYLSFTSLRLHKDIYIDKTAYIKKILELKGANGQPFVFLSRPRRFGKTMFLEMLEQFFLGNKSLFYDMTIASQMPEDWIKYPVIRIDFLFAPPISSLKGIARFKELLEEKLCMIGERYGLDCKSSSNINILIEKLRLKTKQRVVILIDEYDKVFKKLPSCDNVVFEEYEELIATFYQAFKQQVNNIKLLFITGISRQALPLFESGLSQANIYDLTFNKDFSTAMGFTLHEIESNYGPHLKMLADKYNMDYPSIIKNLTNWYDGYRFSFEDHPKIYNPVSIITALTNQKVAHYWARTGTIRRPIQRMLKSKKRCEELLYYDLERSKLEEIYNDEHEASVPLPVLLYNYGYLTILRYKEGSNTVFIGYPNREIQEVIFKELNYAKTDTIYTAAIKKTYIVGDIEHFIEFINKAAFWGPVVPNLKTDEPVATQIMITALKLSGLFTEKSGLMLYGSDAKTKGDLDIILTPPNIIPMVISIKHKKSAFAATRQQIEYAIFWPTELQKGIGKIPEDDSPANAQLLGIDIRGRKGELPAIKEWILLQYREGKIPMDETVASSQDVLNKLKNDLLETTKFWDEKQCESACNVLQWKSDDGIFTPELNLINDLGVEVVELSGFRAKRMKKLVNDLKDTQYLFLYFTWYDTKINRDELVKFFQIYCSEINLVKNDIFRFYNPKTPKFAAVVRFPSTKSVENQLKKFIKESKSQTKEKKALLKIEPKNDLPTFKLYQPLSGFRKELKRRLEVWKPLNHPV